MCEADHIICALVREFWKVGAPLTVAAIIFIVRNAWTRPRLRLSIAEETGNLLKNSGGSKERWFHIAISNSWPYSIAQNVAVYLVGVERKNVSGTFIQEPFPRVRMNWPYELALHGEKGADARRNIGKGDLCDLCRYRSDGSLYVALHLQPLSIAEDFKVPGTVRLHLKVIGDNFESKNPLVVEICWDGNWAEDAQELKKHFSLRVI